MGVAVHVLFGLDFDVITDLGSDDCLSNPCDKVWYICSADEGEFNNGNLPALQILLIAQILISGK